MKDGAGGRIGAEVSGFLAADPFGFSGRLGTFYMFDTYEDADKFAYEPGSSTANTTALDSFVERRGICRDFAHVAVTLARASGIPARFVSGYAPGVKPPDFHAVAEVFLADPAGGGGGAWCLVDATGMAAPAELVKIGVGRDAADVSFLTSFGMCEFLDKTVSVGVTG